MTRKAVWVMWDLANPVFASDPITANKMKAKEIIRVHRLLSRIITIVLPLTMALPLSRLHDRKLESYS